MRNLIENVAVITGLIGVQLIYFGNAVLMAYAMSLGLKFLTIVIFTSLATFFILFPFAFCFERTKWPAKLSFKLITQLLLLSFGGVAFQSFFLKGLDLTSPAMGTAMPNIAPGLIFIIAWTFGLEKINLRNKYSRVKILGTLLCVLGALTMSIMQSLSTPANDNEVTIPFSSTPTESSIFDKQKILGCFYLMAAVFILSSIIVLQAFALGDFPVPMSLSAITSLFGAFMTAGVQLIEDHELNTGWPLVSVGNLIGYSLLAGAVSGICQSVNGWALKKRGPVLVSMFSPIGTVCSVVYSVVSYGDTINFGSLAGMFIMFLGLYLVLWSKGKESYSNGNGLASESDVEKPLLS